MNGEGQSGTYSQNIFDFFLVRRQGYARPLDGRRGLNRRHVGESQWLITCKGRSYIIMVGRCAYQEPAVCIRFDGRGDFDSLKNV